MKVGTDGVLLGAWADIKDATNILDIGTGSGLIALMLAQRSMAQITAIDIDENAIIQAQLNVNNSPWTNRIQLIECNLTEFTRSVSLKFDVIVSNPPFFKNSLKTPNISRTVARHASTDFHNEIIASAQELLTETGKLYLILPLTEGNECICFAQKSGFFCTKKTYVYPKPHSPAKRLLLEFARQKSDCDGSELYIETNERHHYSDAFTNLVKNFYLKL